MTEPLITRIAASLGMTVRMMAWHIGESPDELEKLARAWPGQVVAVNRDVMWAKLDALVSERLAGLMAIRQEMSRKLAKDRERQLSARIRVEKRL